MVNVSHRYVLCPHRVDVSCCTTLLWHCCDRGNGIRAVVPVLPSQRPVPGHRNRRPRTLKCVQRQIIDYALQRKARLAEVHSGRRAVADVCDASPYLLRAAKFHDARRPRCARFAGKSRSRWCPGCSATNSARYRDRPGQPKRSPASPAPRRSSPCTSSRSAEHAAGTIWCSRTLRVCHRDRPAGAESPSRSHRSLRP